MLFTKFFKQMDIKKYKWNCKRGRSFGGVVLGAGTMESIELAILVCGVAKMFFLNKYQYLIKI